MENDEIMLNYQPTLEDILKIYFRCTNPFNAAGDLTPKGAVAYGKLTTLIYNIGSLTNVDMDNVIRKLDEIANEKF